MALTRQQFDQKLSERNVPADKHAFLRNKYFKEAVNPGLKDVSREKRVPVYQEWGRIDKPQPAPNVTGGLMDAAMGMSRAILDEGPLGQARRGLDRVARAVTDPVSRAVGLPDSAQSDKLMGRHRDGRIIAPPGEYDDPETYMGAAGQLAGAVADPSNLIMPARAARLAKLARGPVRKAAAVARGAAETSAAMGVMGAGTAAMGDVNDGRSIDWQRAQEAGVTGAKLGLAVGALPAAAALVPAGRLNPRIPTRLPSRKPPAALEFDPLAPDAVPVDAPPPMATPNDHRAAAYAIQHKAATLARATASGTVAPGKPTTIVQRPPVQPGEMPQVDLPDLPPFEQIPSRYRVEGGNPEQMGRSAAMERVQTEPPTGPSLTVRPGHKGPYTLDEILEMQEMFMAQGAPRRAPAGTPEPLPPVPPSLRPRPEVPGPEPLPADAQAMRATIPRAGQVQPLPAGGAIADPSAPNLFAQRREILADTPPVGAEGFGWGDMMRDESGRATPEGAVMTPLEAAALPVRGVFHAAKAIDKGIEAVGRGLHRMTGDVDAATGESRLGQRGADLYDRVREYPRELIMGPKLGGDYKDIKNLRMAEGHGIAQEGADVARNLRRDLSQDQIEELYRVLNDRTLTETELAHVSEPVRARIDAMSKEMTELGTLNDAQFTANEGQYLRRLYEQYLTDSPSIGGILAKMKKWAGREEAPGKMIAGEPSPRSASSRTKGSRYRGKKRDMSEAQMAELNRPWQEVSRQDGKVTIRDTATGQSKTVGDRQAGEYLGNWKTLVTRKDGRINAWRDYTKAERVAMGESEDAALAIQATFQKAGRELRNGRLLRDVANDRAMSVPAEMVDAGLATVPDGWQLLDGGRNASGLPSWGKLDRHYVRPDIHQDLTMTRIMREEARTWRTLMSYWKKGKTVYNPASHVNNAMQNAIALELNGGSVFDLPEAGRMILDKSPEFLEAQRLGAFNNTAALTDLAGAIQLTPKSPTGIIGHVINKGTQLDQMATGAYQGADDLFRMALIIRKTREGMAMKDAVSLANERLYHGDINSPIIDKAAMTVLPFIRPVAWTLAEVPKMVMRNPIKVAKLALYWEMWNAFATSSSGQTAEQVAAREELYPDYQQAGMFGALPKMAQVPWKDSNEQTLVADTQNWGPGNTFAADGESAIPFVPRFLNPGGPLNTLYELMTNHDNFRDKEIRNDATSTGQQAYDVGRKVAGDLSPGILTHAQKVVDAALGIPDYGGRKYDMPTALLNVLGVKIQPFDDQAAYQKLAVKFNRQLEDMTKVLQDARREAASTNNWDGFEETRKTQEGLIAAKIEEMRSRLDRAQPAIAAPAPAGASR